MKTYPEIRINGKLLVEFSQIHVEIALYTVLLCVLCRSVFFFAGFHNKQIFINNFITIFLVQNIYFNKSFYPNKILQIAGSQRSLPFNESNKTK